MSFSGEFVNEPALIETQSNDKKSEIKTEIDNIIKKLEEKNYVITNENIDKFKTVLKENLLKK
mgnify:CR=1 FL=1